MCINCKCFDFEREKTVKHHDFVWSFTHCTKHLMHSKDFSNFSSHLSPLTHFTPHTLCRHSFSVAHIFPFTAPHSLQDTKPPLCAPTTTSLFSQAQKNSELPLLPIWMSCENSHIQMQSQPVIRSICQPPTYHMPVSLSQGRIQKKHLNMHTQH